MRRLFPILLLLLTVLPGPARAEQPALVVNIVVSQFRYDYISKFYSNLSGGGLRRFMDQGVFFTDARYNFMQTTTPATLATLTTGADPSTHGIISERWIDYTNNRRVYLIEDLYATGLDSDHGIGRYAQGNLIVPTLGDRLKEESPQSKVITIAADPVSAIVLGGMLSDVYWMDQTRGSWISSTAYMNRLPSWVSGFNSRRTASQYLDWRWSLTLPRDRYVNSAYSVVDFNPDSRFRRILDFEFLRKKNFTRDYPGIIYTPAGNTLVTEFAKEAVINENLGQNGTTDLLNICYDAPRHIGQLYGGESMEVEDMFYRLDMEIAGLLSLIESRLDMQRVVIVLTSDHGGSDSYDYGENERERFNASQFRVILNGFMNAQYGTGDWVIDYCDRQVYLNRNLIYNSGLSLEEVQNRVAAFALQFRGISHVLTSTAMLNSYFSGSYAGKMQNSYYPKRSGDLTINLMPGWIEEREGVRAASGSMYEYDVHVPLVVLGNGFGKQVITRNVNMRDVAPTLARIMQISRPIAAEGEPIEEITTYF